MKWMNKLDKRFARFSIYLIITVVIINIIGKLSDNAEAIFSAFMSGVGWILTVVKPIILGFVMAYILQPLNDFFTDKYSKIRIFWKHARVMGVVTVLLLLILSITAVVSVAIYSMTHQLQLASFDAFLDAIATLVKSVTDFYETLLEKLALADIRSEQVNEYLSSISAKAVAVVQNIASTLINSITNVSSYLMTLMFGLIIGIYFMIDGNSIMAYFSDVSDAIFSDRVNAKIRRVLKDLDEVFSGYIRGQLMDVLFMICAAGTAMMLTGISLAPIIGLLTGIANLIPYLGPFVGYASIILVSVVEGKYDVMVISIIAMFIIQTLDGNIIEAKLLGKSIQIHPLLVVIFLIFGSAIGGVTGMLLAVPIGAYVQKLFTRFVERRKVAKQIVRQSSEEL
ncbi:MAG: AI-2E family transporter [Lachnospiraceae bacterium]|nr:AI-2E family transporter [Lachnospiraceae bacterium]